jgi:hypothetical protein
MSSTCCVTVAPLKLTASEETIRSAIKFSSVLPVPGFSLDTPQIEAIEIDYLSRTLGWSDPRGLFGYSETSEYKDLYVYFDYGDKTSAVNELATKAFKMYGLGGAMVGRAEPTWGNIRGTVIIVRLEPDPTFSPNLVYIQTLLWMKYTEHSSSFVMLKLALIRLPSRGIVLVLTNHRHRDLIQASGLVSLPPTLALPEHAQLNRRKLI